MSQKKPSNNGVRENLSFIKSLHIEGGDSLAYSLLQPLTIQQGTKFPLVIFLHGVGERGTDNVAQLKHVQILYNRKTLEKYPSFVLAPQCPVKYTWTDYKGGKDFKQLPTRPMQMLMQIVDKMLRDYPIDTARIYVTGLSMGGFATWDLITRYPNKFAAAVPICGGGDDRKASLIRHIPIWAFHGALDKVVLPQRSRAMIQALHNTGAAPGYTEYPDVAHDSWVPAYKDPQLLSWLFSQRLQPKVNQQSK